MVKFKSKEDYEGLNDTRYIERESRLVKEVCEMILNDKGQLTERTDQIIKFLLLILDRPTDEEPEVT